MFATLTIAALAVIGQNCPGGVCRAPGPAYRPAVAPVVVQPPAIVKGWHRTADGRTVWGWIENGWIRFHESEQPATAPAPKPDPGPSPATPETPAEADEFPPAGVMLEQSHETPPKGQSKYLARGATAKAFTDALGDGRDPSALPDDADAPRVTVIGQESETRQAEADARSGALDPAVFQSYRPGDWAISGLGFPGSGVIVQDAGGKVIHKSGRYQQADVIGALRRADPDYDPARGPDAGGTGGLIALAVIVAVAFLVATTPPPASPQQ